MRNWTRLWRKCRYRFLWTLGLLTFSMGIAKGQGYSKAGQVDLFAGVDFNYRDLTAKRMYDFLINLTPGVKWDMGKGWKTSAQVLIPVYNDFGDRYKKVRLNMAVLSKEAAVGSRLFVKASGGLFGSERYGLDLKGMYVVNDWLAMELQAGWTGYCSMAVDWEASTPERLTALVGADVYLNRWNTQFRVKGGRFLYKDNGGIAEAMRHFRHCTVGVYAQYSDKAGYDGGFKFTIMIPPYKRVRRKFNVRPASNFRHVYSIEADGYANRMYMTDPEENEREGWFDRERFRWGSNKMEADFKYREP